MGNFWEELEGIIGKLLSILQAHAGLPHMHAAKTKLSYKKQNYLIKNKTIAIATLVV